MNRIGLRTRTWNRTDPWLDDDVAEVLDLMSLGGGESRRSQYTGVKALMVAMLEDAIQCYVNASGRMRTDAEHWIASASHRPTFSFCTVCETLGLDPDAARAVIQRLPRTNGTRRRVLPRSRPNARRHGAVESDAAPVL